jgi:hypothetical protein
MNLGVLTVNSEAVDVVDAGLTEIAQTLHSICDGVVFGHYGTALHCVKQLRRMETQCRRRAICTKRPTLVAGTEGVGGIIYYWYIVTLAQCAECIYVARISIYMGREDAVRPFLE